MLKGGWLESGVPDALRDRGCDVERGSVRGGPSVCQRRSREVF